MSRQACGTLHGLSNCVVSCYGQRDNAAMDGWLQPTLGAHLFFGSFPGKNQLRAARLLGYLITCGLHKKPTRDVKSYIPLLAFDYRIRPIQAESIQSRF
jgi:hypothetical protein